MYAHRPRLHFTITNDMQPCQSCCFMEADHTTPHHNALNNAALHCIHEPCVAPHAVMARYFITTHEVAPHHVAWRRANHTTLLITTHGPAIRRLPCSHHIPAPFASHDNKLRCNPSPQNNICMAPCALAHIWNTPNHDAPCYFRMREGVHTYRHTWHIMCMCDPPLLPPRWTPPKYTHTHTYVHTCVYAAMHPCIYASMHAYTHTGTYVHTYSTYRQAYNVT